MNHRQKKKRSIFMYGGYTVHRKSRRKIHENSIKLSRIEHRNYWEEWKRGYPNKFPYKKWFDAPKMK